MKVRHFVGSLSRSAGGLHYAVAGLAKALQRAGVDIAVIGRADKYFQEDAGQWGEVPLIPLPHGRYGLSVAGIRQAMAANTDIVHVHGIWNSVSLYGRMAGLLGTATVVTPHGMLDPWILARRRPAKAIHALLIERPLLRRGLVHALNEAESKAVASFLQGREHRTFIAPNGIEGIGELPATTERRGALYLGRLHPKKQVLQLMKAWRDAPTLRNEPLTVAGWGDEQYQNEVIAASSSAPGLAFAGPLYGEAKEAAFQRARVFILPSLSEGLPMAVLEALACGCIPIITDACNLPELFRDGVAYRIRSDLSDLEQTVQACLAMPQAEFEQRSNSARRYAQNYLWSRIANKVLDEYEKLLAARAGRHAG